MSAKYFPISTRRAAVHLYIEGHTGSSVAKRFGVTPTALGNWVRAAGAKRGDTKEEVDAKLDAWAEGCKEAGAERAKAAPKNAKVIDRIARHRYGPTAKSKEEAKKQFSGLLDPEQYQEAISTHMNQVVETLERCTTPQEQVNAQIVGMGLAMLKGLIDNPLPITTINDLKTVVGLVRQGLGMDDKKSADPDRIDLRILSAITPKQVQRERPAKVIEVSEESDDLDI